MKQEVLMSYVDHTLLSPTATWEGIRQICEEAIAYGTASVCIPPSYCGRVHAAFGDKLTICTVIGFPLGYSVTAAKVAEIEQGLLDGVSEFDMVVNLTDVKNGNFAAVLQEIKMLKCAVGSKILKVIIETCYLTDAEKIELCKAVTEAGADFIKTSTGFGTGGATLADIRLFKAHIGPKVRIKAAGGIRSLEDMERFIEEGVSRIGTSSAIKLLSGGNES
ncbi:MAG: deoxyribose-phosphate aldolase [Lachnospiraceae bacterium]